MSNWTEIAPLELDINAFQRIGKDWMLVTAEKPDGKANTMTASWGGLGVMWGKNVAFVVIRPQRYTKEFIDAAASFSLSFYPESFRKQLSYLGKVSGRDEDKISKSQLTLAHFEDTPYFEEADAVLICQKLFTQAYTPDSFIDGEIGQWYPQADYHTLYIAEVRNVLVKKA